MAPYDVAGTLNPRLFSYMAPYDVAGTLNPCLLSYMALYDVASTIHQTLPRELIARDVEVHLVLVRRAGSPDSPHR
jgi:hypothetical protein